MSISKVYGITEREKRTLTDRVQALENDMRAVKKDIEALKSKERKDDSIIADI